MRHHLLPVVGLMFAASGSAAPVPKAARADDATAILGKWRVEAVHIVGERSADYPTDVAFDFQSDAVVVQTAGGDKTARRYAYKLEPAESPPRLRLTRDGSKHTDRCVYELKGDTLLLGFLADEKSVPEKLAPAQGLVLYTMTRSKSGK